MSEFVNHGTGRLTDKVQFKSIKTEQGVEAILLFLEENVFFCVFLLVWQVKGLLPRLLKVHLLWQIDVAIERGAVILISFNIQTKSYT